MSATSSKPKVGVEKHFTSSILLWVRTDQPREKGMDHWKGPHSAIISASPGLQEYRQIHLAKVNPGLWPPFEGIQTHIPDDRKADGVADVTFQSALAPLKGRGQTKLAYQDEINVFRRTLLYAGLPGTSRWYEVAGPTARVGARALVYLRRRDGVSSRSFGKLDEHGMVPTLIETGALKELRTQTFLPWNKKTWDTPHVAHDNPPDQRFHASVVLGFADPSARAAFFQGPEIQHLSQLLAPVASAIHAYDIFAALTFVKDGKILPHYEE